MKEETARQAFAERLVKRMSARGMQSARNAKSGVDVGPLAKAAGVSREMARRYTQGSAVPDVDRMKKIADWLEVRVTWLRDGEGTADESTAPHGVRETGAQPYMPEEALEIARVWMKLPKERREWFRDLMCLEAVVANHYPWLMFGRPRSESYRDYERRVERDLLRIAARLQGAK
jgi:transcriptional regulator with XRE-family HTH domain